MTVDSTDRYQQVAAERYSQLRQRPQQDMIADADSPTRRSKELRR